MDTVLVCEAIFEHFMGRSVYGFLYTGISRFILARLISELELQQDLLRRAIAPINVW